MNGETGVLHSFGVWPVPVHSCVVAISEPLRSVIRQPPRAGRTRGKWLTSRCQGHGPVKA
jgi:hypothetical protein